MTKEEKERLQDLPIVFYDGTCGFCQASIQIALKHNTQQNLHFAALQSEVRAGAGAQMKPLSG